MGHTPTPWHVCETTWPDGIETINIAAEDEYHVCKVSSRYENAEGSENEANAAYIVECVNSHASLVEEVERLREALTPSGETKAAYMGEFSIGFPDADENGIEYTRKINVPWTTIKEIMAAIRERANA